MRVSLALFKRSAWKGPNVVPFDNLRPAGSGKTPPIIKTQARAASILPAFVGLRFAIHNGKHYQEVYITEEMVGRKLGEFVPTRKRFTYKMSKNK
ncbi:mitochondrial ribosomal small subunit component [Exophiala xenobiotica]|nr:mitochondrial ribosomal small subunit component [Exophiala xenobiotica]